MHTCRKGDTNDLVHIAPITPTTMPTSKFMTRDGEIYTAQGATLTGLVPYCEAEKKLWAFATFLREAIFAIPIGVTYAERDEWMDGIRDLYVCISQNTFGAAYIVCDQ